MRKSDLISRNNGRLVCLSVCMYVYTYYVYTCTLSKVRCIQNIYGIRTILEQSFQNSSNIGGFDV